MKTKAKVKAKVAKKVKAVPVRVPLASRNAAEIIGALKVAKVAAPNTTGPVSKVAPTTTRSHAVEAKFAAPVNVAPTVPTGFAEMYHARGGRLWFQVVATPELRAKVEMLKAKAGARTLNDLAAKLFDAAFAQYGI